MAILQNKQVLASLFFILFGSTFAIISWLHHPLGTAASMGRGFFPFWVGTFLAGLGVAGLLRGATSAESDPDERVSIKMRSLACVIGAVITFGVLAPLFGLYVATITCVLVASRADPGFRVIPALLLGLGLAAAAHIAFVVGLGLPIPVLPTVIAQ